MSAFVERMVKAYIDTLGIHDLLALYDYVTVRIKKTIKEAERTDSTEVASA